MDQLIPARILFTLLAICLLAGCRSTKGDTIEVVKPRYHHTWYKKHVYKKKWHVGRIHLRPEKQGVKRVKVKN